MIHRMDTTDWPAGTTLALEPDPAPAFRAELARHIHAFHSRTVPYEAQRFGLALRNGEGRLLAGMTGLTSWGWLFVEAVWVDDVQRGRGTGRRLMEAAETYARTQGCHSAWLDTFQAEGFYRALGYERFGVLDDYPAGQTRAFLRKRLG